MQLLKHNTAWEEPLHWTFVDVYDRIKAEFLEGRKTDIKRKVYETPCNFKMNQRFAGKKTPRQLLNIKGGGFDGRVSDITSQHSTNPSIYMWRRIQSTKSQETFVDTQPTTVEQNTIDKILGEAKFTFVFFRYTIVFFRFTSKLIIEINIRSNSPYIFPWF